jgi:predicted chitinase
MHSITATNQTFLKKQPIQSADLSTNQKVLVELGKTYQVEEYELAETGHYKVKLGYEAGEWYLWSGHWHLPWEDNTEILEDLKPDFFTSENLKVIMPNATSSDIAIYLKPLNKILYKFQINTTARACALIAQIAHESGSLKYKEEIADGSAYERRTDLGNTQPGDGKRYKGRGLIQLTGRFNYRKCGQALGLPLEEKPELVISDPYINAAVAGWYWKSRNINEPADRGDFQMVTRLINGGLNGYHDRLEFWERAKRALKLIRIPEGINDINWHDMSDRVSKYFTIREVTMGDTRRIPREDYIKSNILKTAQDLDSLRENWGSPITTTSWYRPPAINRAVGGVQDSQHLVGLGVDICPISGDIYKFQEWLDNIGWKYKALGYGAKKGFVHLDSRQGRIRWNY